MNRLGLATVFEDSDESDANSRQLAPRDHQLFGRSRKEKSEMAAMGLEPKKAVNLQVEVPSFLQNSFLGNKNNKLTSSSSSQNAFLNPPAFLQLGLDRTDKPQPPAPSTIPLRTRAGWGKGYGEINQVGGTRHAEDRGGKKSEEVGKPREKIKLRPLGSGSDRSSDVALSSRSSVDHKTYFKWARTGKIEKLSKAIANKEVDLEVRNEEGKSLLHVAARHGQRALAKHLMQLGLDPLLLDKKGRTAAKTAADRGYAWHAELEGARGGEDTQENILRKPSLESSLPSPNGSSQASTSSTVEAAGKRCVKVGKEEQEEQEEHESDFSLDEVASSRCISEFDSYESSVENFQMLPSSFMQEDMREETRGEEGKKRKESEQHEQVQKVVRRDEVVLATASKEEEEEEEEHVEFSSSLSSIFSKFGVSMQDASSLSDDVNTPSKAIGSSPAPSFSPSSSPDKLLPHLDQTRQSSGRHLLAGRGEQLPCIECSVNEEEMREEKKSEQTIQGEETRLEAEKLVQEERPPPSIEIESERVGKIPASSLTSMSTIASDLLRPQESSQQGSRGGGGGGGGTCDGSFYSDFCQVATLHGEEELDSSERRWGATWPGDHRAAGEQVEESESSAHRSMLGRRISAGPETLNSRVYVGGAGAGAGLVRAWGDARGGMGSGGGDSLRIPARVPPFDLDKSFEELVRQTRGEQGDWTLRNIRKVSRQYHAVI